MAKVGDQIALRDAYGDALARLGSENSLVVALEADVGSSSKSIVFGKQFPDRYFNVGIAELNMVTMAAGFAISGHIPFVNTFAVFMTTRGADAIQSLIAYDKLNVKLAGTYCGLSDSYDGASHHSIADMAFVQAIPNITILSPCDAAQMGKAVKAAAELKGPVYLRISRASAKTIYNDSSEFVIGKGIQLQDGMDLTVVATGTMVQRALSAAEKARTQGVSIRVIDMHTVKPIDSQLLLRCAQETGAIVVAEEHSIYGGLGSAVAKVLTEENPVAMGYIGVSDFAESGDYDQLITKYGLDDSAILNKCLEVLKRK